MKTTTLSSLNMQARKMLMDFQHQGTTISESAQQQITTQAAEKNRELTVDELEAVLVQQMPDQAKQVKQAKPSCSGSSYHPDGKVHDFMTQIVGLRIEKEDAQIHRPRVHTPPVRRDPLFSQLVIDPSAECVLLFNARDVDQTGRPLLMKVVAREGADVDSMDFSGYRTKWEDTPDIMRIGRDEAFVETKDVHEAEFEFGDPLLQVTFDAKGTETSRSVAVNPDNEHITNWYHPKTVDGQQVPDTDRPPARAGNTQTGIQLDRTHVVTFTDRVGLVASLEPEQPGSIWANGDLDRFDVKIFAEAGLMFEPDAMAEIELINKEIRTEVPSDDAFLVGSPAVSSELGDTGHYKFSDLLRQFINVKTRSNATEFNAQEAANSGTTHHHRRQPAEFRAGDENTDRIKVMDLLFPARENITVAGKPLAPGGDFDFKREDLKGIGVSGSYSTIEGNPKGHDLKIKFKAGLVTAAEGASIKGWSVCAGYTDSKGNWQGTKLKTLDKDDKSGGFTLNLEIPDVGDAFKATKGQFEVRIFNESGLPAQRLMVPATAFKWAN